MPDNTSVQTQPLKISRWVWITILAIVLDQASKLLADTVVVSLFIFLWLKKLKTHQTIQYTALALVLGGALGNLIDRAVYGHVIDFIDVYYQQHRWPAFNIADSVITIGAFLLIYDTLKNPDEKSKS